MVACNQSENPKVERANSDPVDEIPTEVMEVEEEVDVLEEPTKQEVVNTSKENEDFKKIFGEEEYQTKVSGYLKVEKEMVFEEELDVSYLVITDFTDNAFSDAIDQGIEKGNTVNKKEEDSYFFNLGCLEDGKVVGVDHEEGQAYLNEVTQEALLNSSADNPVSLELNFGIHPGIGCTCCNLAHQIRLAE